MHISLVICVRGYTYHGDTHITVDTGTKNISDRAFLHTQNADFGSIFCAGAMLRCFGLVSESSHIGQVFVTLS